MTSRKLSNDELLEKIVADYTRRIRAGKPPEISKYQRKFPHLKHEIEELLPSVAMIEGLKIESESQSSEPRDEGLSQLKQLGDYLLIREVGRGGMGVVFEAVHQSLGRRVAVKVMRQRDIDDEKYLARFRKEAQSAARLHHTNIVSVFGVGQSEGYHYYMMEFIDGISLNRVVKDITRQLTGIQVPDQTEISTAHDAPTRDVNLNVEDKTDDGIQFSLSQNSTAPSPANDQLPVGSERYRWVANVGSQIADALAHAHSQGILHRDIKPANLLLDQDDKVWITDFGLVKEIDVQDLTKTGDLVGTPQYMAPEAFKGEYDQRSETYCLGLTLYELATLKPAHQHGSAAELFHRITNTDPAAPKTIDPKIPRDLGIIIEQAISRDPGARYQTAKAFRDDLRAFFEDRSISARRPSMFEQVWRWSRRNPLPATLSALSAVLLCAVAISASVGYLMTTNAYKELSKEAKLTEAARALAVENEKKAKANERAMRIEYNRADSNVNLAIKAFDQMFREIISPGNSKAIEFDGFSELGGIETAVTREDAEFLKKMMRFYEQFASQNTGNQELELESAKAYRRVANINYLIGETPTAINAYRKSIKIYEPVQESSPDNLEALLNLVNTRSELSAALRRQGDFNGAYKEVEKNDKLLKAHPLRENPEIQLALARSLVSAGSTVVNIAAVVNASDVSELFENNERLPMRGDGRGMIRVVDRFRMADRRFPRDANRAIEIGKELCKKDPKNPDYRLVLGKAFSSLGAVQLNMAKSDNRTAEQNLNQATRVFRSLIDDEPNNFEYKYSLAINFLLYPDESNDSGYVERLTKVKEIANELVDKSSRLEYKQLKIMSHIKFAVLHLIDEDPDQAMKEQQEARTFLQQLDKQVLGERDFRYVNSAMMRNYMILEVMFRRNGNMRMASQARQIAGSYRNKSHRKKPDGWPHERFPDRQQGKQPPPPGDRAPRRGN